ncbi:MAG: hypothetical protein H6R07_238 [Proteobacteria bacterium]|nr:hypothetical protein [Pseudomonadota bacterium]
MNDIVKIVFKGSLAPGKTQDEVAPRLAVALKIATQNVHSLFSGKPVVLKRNVPRADSLRYITYLAQLGILVEAESETPQPPAEDLLFPSLFGNTAAVAVATAPPGAAALALAPEMMDCPKCGVEQPKRTLCKACGVDMPRFQAAQFEMAHTPAVVTTSASRATPDAALEDGAEFTPEFRDFSFEGRLGRIRYMSYCFGASLITGGVLGLLLALGLIRNMIGIGFFGLIFLVYLVRLTSLRLHDMDRSAWWQCLAIPLSALQSYAAYKMLSGGTAGLLYLSAIPLFIYSLWIFAWPGSSKINRFGLPNERNTAFGYIGAVLFVALMIGGGVGTKQKGLLQQKQAAPEESQRNLVVLYCTPNSGACHEARNWFLRHPRLPYDDCDIETSADCRREFDRIGGQVVPTLVVGNNKHDGFSEEWLMAEVKAEILRQARAAPESPENSASDEDDE